MGFQGYHIKNTENEKIFPSSILKEGGEGYHATPDMIQDKNAYTDGIGETRRSPLPHTKSKVYLNTLDHIPEAIKLEIQAVLNNRLRMNLEYWNDNIHAYKTGKFYMTDIDWKHERIDPKTYEITYAGISITLIEY